MHKSVRDFLSKNPSKQENLGTRCKKIPSAQKQEKFWVLEKKVLDPAQTAGPRWNFNVGRPGRNTGNAPILAAADRRVFGLLIVGQLQLIKHVEYQAKDHSGDAGQHHTGELDVSKVHLNAGEAGNEDHGSQGLVPVLAVVHLGIHQDPQAGGADHSIKQEGDPADDRAGMVWIRADSFPMKEQMMENTAAPAMTWTLYTW